MTLFITFKFDKNEEKRGAMDLSIAMASSSFLLDSRTRDAGDGDGDGLHKCVCADQIRNPEEE